MKIKVRTHQVIHNHAIAMCTLLRSMGHEAELVTDIDPDDDTLHLIYVAFSTVVPRRYILYQTEVYGNSWWDDNYLTKCRSALQIWDYAQANLDHYDFGCPKFLIPPFEFDAGPQPQRIIDLLFYGHVNDRRGRWLGNIRRRTGKQITVVQGSYGEAMLDTLRRTRTVINLHAYDSSPLELFRITEALSCGCRIVTEGMGDNSLSPRIRYQRHPGDILEWIVKPWPAHDDSLIFQPPTEQIAQALALIPAASV